MKKWMARISSVVAAAGAVAALSVVTGGGVAQADENCRLDVICSNVKNSSSLWITAIHNWTCGGSTGDFSTGCASGATYPLGPGQWTPVREDWDVLQVDAGWCYKVEFENLFGHTWQRTYNQTLAPNLHVKIESGDRGTVLAQRYGSCP